MQKKYSGICAGCVHWQPIESKLIIGFNPVAQKAGECRRHTPMFIERSGRVFPVTGFNDWCSEGTGAEKEVDRKDRHWWQFWKWGKK
jgi:hypothetical protein